MPVYVGCCGFPTSQQYYYQHLSVVEIQQTFYEPPRLTTAQRWRDLFPSHFRFTMKAWQPITHQASSPTYRRMKTRIFHENKSAYGGFQLSEQVWGAWERTRDFARMLRACAIVFQCPASFEPTSLNKTNMRSFFQKVVNERDERDRYLLVWEPRGKWSDQDIAPLCNEFELIHCVDPFQRKSVTRGRFYYRLHGIGGSHHHFTDAELGKLVSIFRGFEFGFSLFNNVSMLADALRCKKLLEEA